MIRDKIIAGVFILASMLPHILFSQVLETEESKPLLPGQFEIGTGFEFQISGEGTESALPMAIEYGLTKKITLLVEPVGFTDIRPKSGTGAKGVGDLEMSLFYQLIQEKKILPSISFAGEIKFPTAQSSLIGTGKTDYIPYLILSKTMGSFFTSANFSYTILGRPKDVAINNVYGFALGTIYKLNDHNILFGEIYGNTSALDGVEGSEGSGQPPSNIQIAELSGGEIVAGLGYGYQFANGLLLSFGISYDNNNATLFRPGIEWKFGGK